MKTSMAALVAMLAVGTSLALLQPAGAQSTMESLKERTSSKQGQQQKQQRPRRQEIPGLGRDENTAILPAYLAVQAHDWPAASAAMPAAQAGAQSPAARYLIGQLQLEIGRGTQNTQLQAQAVDAMLASGGAPVEVQPTLLAAQAAFALDHNNFAAAESSLTRLLALDPNNVTRITQLAQVKLRLGKREDALALYQRAMQLSAASGQPAPEDLLRQMLALAYEGRMAGPALEYSRTLITAYPNAENWRSVLGVYRDLNGGAGPAAVDLDLRRLMRTAHALVSEADYADYADAANRAGLPGEAKAVMEEGLARNVFTANAEYARGRVAIYAARIGDQRAGMAAQRTQALGRGTGEEARIAGDTFFSYGEYPQAAELYRAALQKGGPDSNLLNIRLGAALAMAGQRADAEAAFHAVTGPRAQLAAFWLLWLASPH